MQSGLLTGTSRIFNVENQKITRDISQTDLRREADAFVYHTAQPSNSDPQETSYVATAVHEEISDCSNDISLKTK